MSDDLATLDCTAQAELVRRGELKPIELVDAAIARVEKLNPELNAVILPSFEKAREQASSEDLPDGPFRGVPFLLTDFGGQSAGDRYCAGMRYLRELGWSEPADSYVTAKLRAAGFCFLGRTNTSELALLPATEPEVFGPTRNPWNTEHSAGGSSGGSAAAVAAGMVGAAHAEDGGGSIRIPASSCGLIGLKPTRGRCSLGPGAGEREGGCSCEFVVSRTVRDTAAILDVLSGPMPGDPYFAPPPERPFSERMVDAQLLRIGLMTVGPRGIDVHTECVAAAEMAARALASLGHEVEISHPAALDDPAAVSAYVKVAASSTARALDVWSEKGGRPIGSDDVEPVTWGLAEIGRGFRASDYLETLETVNAFSRRMASWWQEGFDLLLTPTSAEPPPPLGEFASTPEVPLKGFLRAAPIAAYTLPFNLTGQPAVSLPVHWTAGGVPVGAQLVAAYGREDLLLQVAAELEKSVPWAERRPPLHA